ncbi:MAG: hypothetical protein JWP25_9017 [Bradyrhizobium sp.]|nr:hypothetical protein [Bradyrhizobium sp.]
MFKKVLPKNQMTNTDTINQAARWARDLAQMRARGPGDLENAMRSVERDYGIDYWFQWTLRYRASRLKDVGHTVFLKLRAAYEAECSRQMTSTPQRRSPGLIALLFARLRLWFARMKGR